MKEHRVRVTALKNMQGVSTKEIAVTKDMTITDFRKKCSEYFHLDFVGIFNPKKVRITDINELSSEAQVIISDRFYLSDEGVSKS